MKRLYRTYRRIRLAISLWGPGTLGGEKVWVSFKTAYKVAKIIW